MKVSIVFLMGLSLLVCSLASAQEAKIHHGFLFFAGETYTVDEKSFGLYDDGNEYSVLIRDNPEALSAFKSYRILHTTAIVSTAVAIAGFVFGGAYYIFQKDLSKSMGNNAGVISFAAGGGFLVIGMVLEFVAWDRISSSAKIYNRGLLDDGSGAMRGFPVPSLAFSQDSARLMLTWDF